MGFYERKILPFFLDRAMGQKEFARIRGQLIPEASGRVLEFGVGSGLNLPFYPAEGVDSVTGVDPSLELQDKARARLGETRVPVEFVAESCEKLPFGDDDFDTIVTTWTLCTIPDANAALAEARRVLKTGGRLLFSEHGLAPDAGVQRWQDRIDPWWGKCSGGCHINRRIDELIESAGFRIDSMETGYIPGPKIATYQYRGSAVPR